MAILGFFGVYINSLALRYPHILRAVLPHGDNFVSTLNIDANALFYTVINRIYGLGPYKVLERTRMLNDPNTTNPEDIKRLAYNWVCRLILDIVKSVAPRDAVIIAVDGAIPMSKIQQQKKRRYKSSLDLAANATFDTNSITPGTRFMNELDSYMRIFFSENFPALGVKKLIYSSYKIDGEGEHKIFQYFRDGTLDPDNGGYHVIYGMDADLIMISLVSNIPRLVMARDSIDLKYEGDFLNDRRERNNVYIDDLRDAISQEILRDTEHTPETRRAFDDFIIGMMLVGNDFLPKPFSMNMMATATENIITNLRNCPPLVDKRRKIIPQSLIDFLRLSAQDEKRDLVALGKEKFTNRVPYFNAARIQGTEDIDVPTFRKGWYANALGPRRPLEGIETVSVSTDVMEMCYHFLHGMAWTFNYYTRGMDAVSWLWYYPYHHAPLISDLHLAATVLLQGSDLGSEVLRTAPLDGEMRINFFHQLVCVMPLYSLRHVPPFLRTLWFEDSPILDLMPVGFCIDTTVTFKADNGTPIIPMADYDRIVNAVSDLNLGDTIYMFLEDTDMIITTSLKTEHLIEENHKLYVAARNKNQAIRASKLPQTKDQPDLPQSAISSETRERIFALNKPAPKPNVQPRRHGGIVRRRPEPGKRYSQLPPIVL